MERVSVLPVPRYGPNQMGLFTNVNINAGSPVYTEIPIAKAMYMDHADNLDNQENVDFLMLLLKNFLDEQLTLDFLHAIHMRQGKPIKSDQVKKAISLGLQYDVSNTVQIAMIMSNYLHCPNSFLTGRAFGVSLYQLTSIVNHSCTPNIMYGYTHKGSIVMYATRDIEPGEELLMSYIPNVERMPRQIRSSTLFELGFLCVCNKCTQFYPEFEMSLKVHPDRLSQLSYLQRLYETCNYEKCYKESMKCLYYFYSFGSYIKMQIIDIIARSILARNVMDVEHGHLIFIDRAKLMLEDVEFERFSKFKLLVYCAIAVLFYQGMKCGLVSKNKKNNLKLQQYWQQYMRVAEPFGCLLSKKGNTVMEFVERV